jgi:hypothetical protein
MSIASHSSGSTSRRDDGTRRGGGSAWERICTYSIRVVAVIVVVIIVVALLAGLAVNRLLRARNRLDDTDSPSNTDIISPLETLAVLMLAFVLVVAAESFKEAEGGAAREAHIVDYMFETAGYAPDPVRERLQASTVCYSRAVRVIEWPSMVDTGQSSPVPSIWSNDFRNSFRQIPQESSLFEMLVNADKDRAEGRLQRLSESTPAIPDILFWFMALTLALTVGGFAYSVPRSRNAFHIATVSVLAVLFAISLFLINDVDRPYSGFVRVEPTEIETIEQEVTGEFAADFGLDRLPCDEHGNRR